MWENFEKKDYGKTLNLPKTDSPMRGNLPEREPEFQKEIFKEYAPVIVKYGRYIPNMESRYDEVLGITLSSANQYAKKY